MSIKAGEQHLRLTKHGRLRFTQRCEAGLKDNEMLAQAWAGRPGYRFLWVPDRKGDGYRLQTVLRAEWNCNVGPDHIVK